jgi:4-diphosphocytidyl-2-C-methyl-D-erythritol kinase
VTVLQQIDLHDTIALYPADDLAVVGFEDDTLVQDSLESLARAAAIGSRWHVRIEKRIPVAAGLGGGSSDAATALVLANETLQAPLSRAALHRVAAGVGVDVPFFLDGGSRLATGDGSESTHVGLPTEYAIVLVLPHDTTKSSTGAVYAEFDERDGAAGFTERASCLRESLAAVATVRDLAKLPSNDLASSPVARELEARGAFRADVSGAGPAVYGLFDDETSATAAASELAAFGLTFGTRPVATADRP